MRVVDNYNYLPGCCWVCRGVAKPIIDMEQDLDGHNSPDDPNPSAVTRLYFCADCAIEMARMVVNSRSLELCRLGELGQAQRVANELAARAEQAEHNLALIAGAVAGVQSSPVERAGSTRQPDGDDPTQGSARPESSTPLPRPQRGRPRREDNLDFLDNA